jgi:hypothetical protein
MKNSIELNDLFINARVFEHLTVGLTKENIEQLLGLKLKNPDIETPDINLYYIDLRSGLEVSVIFDKKNICYEINLDLDENSEANFFIRIDQSVEEINRHTPFEHLLSVICKLNIGWEFDRKRVYLQTVCILLENGLRLYYAFGSKKESDYGLFSIKLILENHELTAR